MFVKDLRREFYELIIRDKVLVLVNYDVDAICALRILQHLFEADNVQYTVTPIANELDLAQAYATHVTNVRSIIFINIGATFDVIEELEHESDVRIFVVDSHRPYDLGNVYRDNIYLLSELEPNERVPPRQDTIDVFDDMPDGPTNEHELQLYDKANQICGMYKMYNYYGEPAAMCFFKLAWQMSKDTNYLLWLAIIGVHDQLMNDKIDRARYDKCYRFLQGHVSRLSHVREERVGGAITDITPAPAPANANADEDEEDNAPPPPRAHTLAITVEPQLHLLLYRNWSLLESMRHTPSVACRLKIWTPRGEKRLLEFFAELGVPLTQCKQKFAAMQLDYRRNVQDWIEALTDKYDLGSLACEGFVGTRGFTAKYPAKDVALAMKALLESPDKDKTANDRFLDTLNALSWTSDEHVEQGLEICRLQLQATLKQIQHILDMNSIGKAGPYLYTVIKEGAPDAKVFSHPGALLSLARFLLQAFVAKTKFAKADSLPFVVIAPNMNEPGTGFLAGIPPLKDARHRNFFAEAFRQIVEERRVGFELVADLYDNCVVRFPYSEKSVDDLLVSITQKLSGAD